MCGWSKKEKNKSGAHLLNAEVFSFYNTYLCSFLNSGSKSRKQIPETAITSEGLE